MKKRVLSLFMVLVLCLTLLPTAAFAEGEDVSISGGVIGGGETGGEGGGVLVPPGGSTGEGGGIYVAPGSPTEGGGGTYIPGEDTRTEIRCVMKPSLIQRSYDGTTDGSTIPIDLTFTDGTDTFTLKEGTGFTAKKTFDSADAGSRTVTVEIELIGDAAAKYKLKAGEETFTIGGYINKAYPELTVSLSQTTCTVGEKILPLLSVSGAPEGAAVTYYYLASELKSLAGSSDVEGSEAMPKIDENTAISEPGTYYVYAKTGETKNYEEERSTTAELTVNKAVVEAASVTRADGTDGGTYESLPAALNAAQNGDTVKLLADHVTDADALNALGENFTFEQYASIVPVVTKTLTLDLNHKTVDYIEVGFSETNEETQEKEILKTGNLTVTSEAAYGRILNLLFMGGALDIQSGEIGGILVDDNGVESPGGGLVCDVNSGSVTISGGTVLGLQVGEDATVTVNGGSAHAGAWLNDSTLNITGGTFGNVQFRNNGGTIAISGGTFDTITNTNGSGSIPLMPLLADNYAFYQGDNAQNSTGKTLTNVTVRPHTHSFENGKCDCGASYVASVTASGGESTNYTSLDDALNAAQDGDTVTLLSDAEITRWHSLSKAFTLELNGKTATTQSEAELYLHAQVTVQDSSTGKTGGMAGTALLNVQSNGDLTIQSGTFNGRIAINDGKLTIKGGTFNQEVDLPRGDSDSVFFSGGTFAKIWYPNSSGSFLDLLADGCAFYDNNNQLVNAANSTGRYLYKVKVKEHQHSFTDGACACGYTCPHTSVDENGACTVCGKQFAASITEGNDVTYYDLFNDALVYAFKNDGCTLKLLADVTGTAVMINNPFLFDLNGHNVDALSVDAKATIKDSGTTKGRIGKVTVSNEKVTDLTLGSLLEEGYAFKYGNGYWANDSYLQTTEGSFVTVEKAPIQSVNVYAKDKNNQEILTIAYGATGEVTLVSSCKLSETSGGKLSCAWYKLTDDTAIPTLEGAAGTSYKLPADLPAGAHTYRVTCTSDHYSKSAEITITVTPISLEGATVTVSNLTYNGNPQEPTVTVKLGDETLSRDNDYTVQVTKQTDAGSYKLTIKGGGNYSGEIKDVEWKIEPMKIDSVMVSSDISKVYDGTAEINMSANEWATALKFKTLSASGVVDVPSKTYTISDAYFVKKSGEETIYSPDAGEKYGITFKITLNDDNYVLQTYGEDTPSTSKVITQSGGATFTIKQATVTSPGEITQLVFNDLAKTYTIDLAKLLPKLSEGCAYGSIQYQGHNYNFTDNAYLDGNDAVSVSKEGVLTLSTVAASTAKVGDQIGTITVPVVTTNYQKFEFTIKVYISERIPPNASGVTVSASDITYGQMLNESKLTATGTMKHPGTGEEVKGTFAWTNPEAKPGAAGDYTASWTFTPAAGYEEYAPATGTVTVKVKPAKLTVSVKASRAYYTGEAQIASIIASGQSVDSTSVTFTYSDKVDGDYTSDEPTFTDAGTYTVYYKAEAANHEPATGTFTVTIDPLPISLLSVSSISKTYDGSADVTLTADKLTFFSKTASRQDITLPNTALTFSDAQFTSKQEDGSYLPSPEVGGGKALSFTMTLTSNNYVFEGKSEGTTEVSDVFATDDVNRFTITKAAAPTDIQTGTLNVVNGTKLEYTYDAKQLLPKAPKGTYGKVSYNCEFPFNLKNGYYVDDIAIKDNILTLTIDALNGGETGKIGTIPVYVTTDNYASFNLPLDLYAVNKITPVADGEITAAGITYGDALSKSTISGKMKDPNTGATVNGTFAWTDGTTKPAANDSYEAEWTFTPAAGYEKYATATGTVTIKVNKATPTFTAPTAQENLTYTGQEQALITAGSVTDYSTMQYSLTENGTYSQDIPTGTDAGAYTVWYRVIGDANHNDTAPASVAVSIGKKPLTITGVTAASKPYDGTTDADISSVTFDNVTLNRGTDYTVTANFDDASVGNGKNITATVTLMEQAAKNYALEQSSFPTTGSIIKAAAPDFTKETALTIVNGHEKTYTVTLPALPTLETPKEYGALTYEIGEIKLNDGYYTSGAKVEDGKLILPIQAVKTDKTGSIGSVQVKVSTTNYHDFTLTINVNATNKIVPTGEPTLSPKALTYGQALSAIKLSGTMKDGDKTVPGTFAWADGTATPSAGSYEAEWKFTPTDGDTYAEADGTVTITVNKAKPAGEPVYTKITAAKKTLADANLKPNTSWPTGTIHWVDKDGKELPETTEVKANTAYKWIFTPTGADADNYTTAEGTVILYSVSTGGGGSSSSDRDTSDSGTVKTETTKNNDGSVTKTETKKDGTKVETTTGKDGSVSQTTTNPNGSSVTEAKAADGSTGTVKTDKHGQTTAETTLSSKAVETAKRNGEAVKAPVEVEATRNSNTAPTVKVELPKSAGETKVEIPVSNATPGTVAVLVHPDGTEEIVKNSVPTENGIQLTVDGSATVKIVDNSKGFIDTQDHWAKDAIDFVSARGLVNGMSATIYAPNNSTTRAQLWTILARQNDADLSGGATWYENAQNWAKDKGVSDGANPNAAINRAQMVTMLWRAMGQPAPATEATFTDVSADSYYASAVSWAVENGVTTGVGGGRFDPTATCTRAQIAAFLARSMK